MPETPFGGGPVWWEQVSSMLAAGLIKTGSDFFEDLYEAVRTKRAIPAKYSDLPNQEGDDMLVRLVARLHDRYLADEDYGLDNFLSTRIRHQTLSTTLRGPLEEQHLITTRPTSDTPYRSNDYWLARLPEGLNAETRNKIDITLSYFSEEYDRIAEEWLRPRLRVRDEAYPDGVFIRVLPNLTFQTLKGVAVQGGDFEYLLEFAFAHFSSQLKLALQPARDVVREGLRRANDTFTVLREEITTALHDVLWVEFFDALAAAFTDVQVTLNQVENWLHLETASDALKVFTVKDAVEIAIEFARRTLRGFYFDLKLNVDSERSISQDLLTAIADVVSIALHNVRRYAAIERPNVSISVTDDKESGELSLVFENEVAHWVCTEDIQEQLVHLRTRVEGNEYRDGTRKEGGTGFMKLKRIVGPYAGHKLSFGFISPTIFRLNVSLILHNIRTNDHILAVPDPKDEQ